jgi:hypothetical protein
MFYHSNHVFFATAMVCDQDQPGAAPLAATATATAAADAPTLAVATAAAAAAPVAVDRYLEELRAFDRMALVSMHRHYFFVLFFNSFCSSARGCCLFRFLYHFLSPVYSFFSDSCLS